MCTNMRGFIHHTEEYMDFAGYPPNPRRNCLHQHIMQVSFEKPSRKCSAFLFPYRADCISFFHCGNEATELPRCLASGHLDFTAFPHFP